MPERTPENVRKYKEICRKNIYPLMKAMNRKPVGSLKHPFIVPGRGAYVNDLWDWDSWFSNVAIRQIVADKGNKADAEELLGLRKGYSEQARILRNRWLCACHHPSKLAFARGTAQLHQYLQDQYAQAMPCQQAAFVIQQNKDDAEWLRDKYMMLAAFVNKYMNFYHNKATGLLY